VFDIYCFIFVTHRDNFDQISELCLHTTGLSQSNSKSWSGPFLRNVRPRFEGTSEFLAMFSLRGIHFFLSDYLALKMKAELSFEASESTATWRHISQDLHFLQHRSENFSHLATEKLLLPPSTIFGVLSVASTTSPHLWHSALSHYTHLYSIIT